MESSVMAALSALMHWLALPEVGLSAVFIVAFVSATLLPLGSEPAVFALVKAQPDLFWPAVLVATLGNTLGGAVTWWMGHAAHQAAVRLHWAAADEDALTTVQPNLPAQHGKAGAQAMAWLHRHGAPACLLSWLPVVGDPLCAVAGWLHLPFWPCVAYMALGKLARYVTMTAALIWVF